MAAEQQPEGIRVAVDMQREKLCIRDRIARGLRDAVAGG